MFFRIVFIFSAAAALFLTAGCATQVEQVPEDYGHVKFKRPDKVVIYSLPLGRALDIEIDII